jgi:hypothetical protein
MKLDHQQFANSVWQHGHLSSKPLTIAEKADGCGRVMIALDQ